MIKVGDTVRIGTYFPTILSVVRSVRQISEMATLDNGWHVPVEQLTVEERAPVEPPVGFEMRTRGGWHRYRVHKGWMSWNDNGQTWAKHVEWADMGSVLQRMLSDDFKDQTFAKLPRA